MKMIYRTFQILLVAVLSLAITPLVAQIEDPVDWTFSTKSLGNGEFELQLNANIEGHWHLYGMDLPADGPVPTSFTFNESSDYKLIGKTKEPKGIEIDDPVFQMRLKYFEHSAVFTQKVKLLSDATKITGELEFMVCDDSKCLPPEYIDFSFDINKSDSPSNEKATSKEEAKPTEEIEENHNDEPGIFNPVSWENSIESLGNDEYLLKATAIIDDHWHLYSVNLPSDDGPIATEFNLLTKEGVEAIGQTGEEGDLKTEYDPNFLMELSYFEGKATITKKVKVTGDINEILAEVYFMVCDDKRCLPPEAVEFTFKFDGTGESASAASTESNEPSDKQSYLGILLLSFLGGLGALLTPCVFPMIPMTVSFFTKQSKTKAEGVRKGVIYGLSIILIYVALSLPFHLFDSVSPDIFHEFSTNPTLNIAFFIIFIVFAISFLGAFEITMPSNWVNKADRASDKGGLIGVFFMALTLILVSFSCTGPAIGLLLGSVLSTDNGATALSIGMLGFGLGLGLPFGLFAAFPGWMNTLPKSGGWLNVVKVSFGFLELAFAFKFLSNADLVLQSGLLKREVFLAIWIAVFSAWSMYMFGLFRLPHDSPLEKLSVGRGVLATFLLGFTIYLLPGLWGAPLSLISGFPPPKFYSEAPNGVGYTKMSFTQASGHSTQGQISVPEGADPEHCPHGLNCFHDYETGMAYAKEVGKPVMLDFTGWACVNCRRMEENVWSDPRVLERLRNDIVLISLYVDERKELPEDEKYVSETTGKKIKTVGNKWSDFQIKKFQSNTQPYYVFLDHEGKQLHESAAYDPDIDLFVKWLDNGKKAFSANSH